MGSIAFDSNTVQLHHSYAAVNVNLIEAPSRLETPGNGHPRDDSESAAYSGQPSPGLPMAYLHRRVVEPPRRGHGRLVAGRLAGGRYPTTRRCSRRVRDAGPRRSFRAFAIGRCNSRRRFAPATGQ
jgi:hypothetical protein